MTFGERIRVRRGELKLSRLELALRLEVSISAVSNYETGVSFPKEEVLLRLFDALEAEPNTLFQDSFRGGGQVLSVSERRLLDQYRRLPAKGQETVRALADALEAAYHEPT